MLNLALHPTLALALQTAPASTATGSQHELVGALMGLLLGIIQLVIGLSIAAFAINKGFAIVGKMLEGINIWAEVKKKNIAVAALGAGVVISYTNVIGSGIEAMTKGVGNLANLDLSAGLSAIVGGIVSLIIALLVASFAITVTFRVMDKLTTDINEKDEFKNNNIAIGVVYAGIMIGVSGLIAAGVSGIGARVSDLINAIL
ncbi:MAG: DUF350 domain-containing protein [Planctomycetes bacterium]|nr:DUF350 domain-containing protein [Planctomycetota bacterium]